MLTEKQQHFLNIITNFYNHNYYYPTIKDIKKIGNYNSYTIVRKYINILTNKEYLIYDEKNRKITYIKDCIKKDNILKIPIINTKEYIDIPISLLKDNKEYLAFQMKFNTLNNHCIRKGDYVIIEKTKNYINNKLVLVKLNNKYKVLKYVKKDSYIYLLSDYNKYFLDSFSNIIGKVVLVIRTSL